MIRHRAAAALATVLLIPLILPGMARAAFGFVPGDPVIQAFDAMGEPYALAGGHPARIVVRFSFNTNEGALEGNAKNVFMDFPPGFSGNPGNVAACRRADFEGILFEGASCDPDAQVGVLKVAPNGFIKLERPIYNIETAPGQLAMQGSSLFGKLSLFMRQRADDFGLTIALADLPQNVAVGEGEIELWGVPADYQEGTVGPRRPFITLPARCDQGPLNIVARADSWQEPEHWVTAGGSTGLPLAGCDTLQLDPAITFGLASRAADSPSGANLELKVPQSEDPDDRVSAVTRAVNVTLPEGVSISPGAVARSSVCTDAELQLGKEQAAMCPPTAKVGALELDVPQLAAPLEGSIYLAQERPDERFRLFLVAEGNGVSAKLVGALHPDPVTGRIAVALDNLPAIGFRRIGLDFAGGPAALLATPMSCGKFTATADFERYDGLPPVDASSAFEITEVAGGRPCPEEPPFLPRLTGGATNALAGQGSGLTLTLSRQSGEQLLDRFSVRLPPGLSANFNSVRLCDEEAVAGAACPADSRVGSAVGAVGSGDDPPVLAGDAYLTGPYRRAPFGLALVFRARIGHFDLGTTVVRAALRVDPESGRLSVQADPLPRSIEGVPIRFQMVGLDIDRPDFVRTPTSCEAASLDADLSSTTGAGATVSSPFRLRGCNSLGFSPRLSVGLTEPGQLRRGGHPGVRIAIRARPGEAGLRSVDIGLPESLRRDLAGLRAICARQDAREGRCPADSRVGTTRASTPLFGRRAGGPVSLVQPTKDGPPELWATLNAEGVRLTVRGKVFSRAGRVHARLVGLPDVPLSKLVMHLDGGGRGLLSLASDPCAGDADRPVVRSALEGWNRAYLIVRGRLGLPGCGGSGDRAGAKRAAVRVG